MSTRTLVILALLALCAACDDKKGGAAAKELDRYANGDAAQSIAYATDGINAMGNLRVGDAGPEVAAMLRTRVLPQLDKFLADAPKMTPPKGFEHIHEKLVELVQAYRAAAAEMLTGDFASGHKALMDTTERFTRWDINFMNTLREHGVKVKPFPMVPLPPASEPEPPKALSPGQCGGAPCKCAPGSEQTNPDGSLKRCIVAEGADLVVSGIPVEPGTEITLHPDGSLASGTLFGFLASDGFACGAAPIRRFTSGDIEDCVLLGDATFGDTKVPEKSRIVRHEQGGLRYAKLPDGKELCVDPAGAPVTPCAAPTWP